MIDLKQSFQKNQVYFPEHYLQDHMEMNMLRVVNYFHLVQNTIQVMLYLFYKYNVLWIWPYACLQRFILPGETSTITIQTQCRTRFLNLNNGKKISHSQLVPLPFILNSLLINVGLQSFELLCTRSYFLSKP